MLAPTLNANSPNSRDRSTHGGTQHAALDLPPRWIGLYPARTARRLRDSASGKHGCTDDRLVGACAVVSLIAAGMAVLIFFVARKRKNRAHS